MKKIIKTVVITAAVGLLASMLSMTAQASEDKLFDEGVLPAENGLVKVHDYGVKQVSNEEFLAIRDNTKASKVTSKKAFIKEFQKNAAKRKTTFTIECSTWDIIEPNVLDYLDQYDNKKTSDDADFLKGGITQLGWTGYVNGNGQQLLNVKLTYTDSAAQVKKVNKSAKKVLKKLKVSGMSDAAKVKTIHDYVVKLVSYDDTLTDHSAYGGLTASKHTTVCQGYSLIMYKLLTDAGVDCHYVTGDAGGPHAWNIVKINGKWYYLDATWDDPSDTTVYDYFLVGSKTLKKDHATDKYYTKRYKVSSSDLNWKKLIENSGNKNDSKVKTKQSDKEKKAAEDALMREELIQALNDTFDEVLSENQDASDYEIQMYDLCKKTFGCVIKNMSDEAFKALLEREDMLDTFMNDTFKLMEDYILDPMMSYMGSDDFMDDVYSAMYSDFSSEDFEGLSDEDMQSLVEAYAYDVFTQVLYAQSEEYTQSIVNEMVKTLNSMAK